MARRLAVVLLLAVLWIAPPALVSGGDADDEGSAAETVARRPPKGSHEDQELWLSLIERQNAIVISRGKALKLLRYLDGARLDLRLAEAARSSPGGAGTKAEGLRERLLAAWHTAFDVLTRQWPVDPRLGCRAEWLSLDVAMESGDPVEVERTRNDARPCLARMKSAVGAMEKADRELEEAVAEARASLPARDASPPAPAGEARSPHPQPQDPPSIQGGG